MLLFVCEVLGRVEGISEAKVSDDDIAIAVQQEVLQLQISVHDALLVQIANTRNKLSE